MVANVAFQNGEEIDFGLAVPLHNGGHTVPLSRSQRKSAESLVETMWGRQPRPTTKKNGETGSLVEPPAVAILGRLLLQATDKLDETFDLVVGQFAFELGHFVLAFFGDFDQVCV